MNNMSQYDRLRHVALRRKCDSSVFKCADDYYRSPECQNSADTVPEGRLYLFLKDQGCEIIDGKFVRRERDHDVIIGYDDVNQLFWYPEGIARICRLVDRIDWNRVFFKTYFEKRSFGHFLVNFNRIWVIRVAIFWFYVTFNSSTIYDAVNGVSVPAMTWSATVLGRIL
ncbi:hypothetical protein C8J56DRAFT_1091551, partial [Mycena floridula]